MALAYTEDSKWHNRDEFFSGRGAIKEFSRHTWSPELDYQLRKETWCYTANRIAVRFEYESHDEDGQWRRSHPYHRNTTKLRIVAGTGREPKFELAVA